MHNSLMLNESIYIVIEFILNLNKITIGKDV